MIQYIMDRYGRIAYIPRIRQVFTVTVNAPKQAVYKIDQPFGLAGCFYGLDALIDCRGSRNPVHKNELKNTDTQRLQGPCLHLKDRVG